MPRTTHTLWPVHRTDKKTGRKRSYFQANVNGSVIHLGTDRKLAKLKLAAELAKTAPAPSNDRPKFVAELIIAYLAHNPKMPAWKVDAWSDFAADDGEGGKALVDIQPDHLVEFHKRLKVATYRRKGKGGKLGPAKPYTPQTIRHYLSAATMILTWAYEQGWIKSIPVRPKTAKPTRAPRDLALDTVDDLFARLPDRLRDVVQFVFFVGCRPSEAGKLRWEWYRPQRGACGTFVIPLESHKTGEKVQMSRTLYLTPDAQAIVDRMPRDRDHVFLNKHGRPFTANAIRLATARRGIKKPYTLRHTFATTALARGVPLQIVSEWLGHRDISTTQIYARVMNQQASAAATALTHLLPAPSAAHPEPKVAASTPSPPSRRRARQSQG